jgi:integrase
VAPGLQRTSLQINAWHTPGTRSRAAMATLRKRGHKWHVQIRRKGYGNLTRTFTRKSDALEWANQTEIEADRRGLSVDPQVLGRLTVANLIERYRDHVVPSKRGHTVETVIIDAFLRHPIANTKLSDLRAAQFASYRDERLETVKPATINRELGIVQHAFEVTRKEWSIPLVTNPVGAISKPQRGNPRDRRLRNGEWDRLMGACRKCRNRLVEPLVSFAVETGMRRGELLNAKWRDLNWTDHTLRIPITKNGHPRTIPLSVGALAVLATLGNVHGGEDRIFPLTCKSVALAWKRLTKRAGIEDLHFHDLRHEAVSRFFELGLTVPEVALISGHRDPRMLFRYTHLKAEDVGRRISHLTSKQN